MIKLDLEQLIAEQVKQTVTQYVKDELSSISVKSIVEQMIKDQIDIKFKDFDFPKESISSNAINWVDNLSGSKIAGGIIQNFASTGIDDKSSSVQLTVLDDHVVVEGEFTATNLTATDTITAKNLSLTGTLEIGTEILDHGPFSQLIQQHSQMMIDDALEPYKPLLKEGNALLNNDSLANSVIFSNLRKVGNLQELSVLGDAKFSETLYISAGGKIGINTEEPRGALTIRDEDAEVSFMKTNRRTMYIGSTRIGGLEIGTNNQPQMTFIEDLIEMNNPIKIMGVKFSVDGRIPERTGEPNEIVFVLYDRKFYMCIGGNSWQAL